MVLGLASCELSISRSYRHVLTPQKIRIFLATLGSII